LLSLKKIDENQAFKARDRRAACRFGKRFFTRPHGVAAKFWLDEILFADIKEKWV
jgi:hypothetical protein